MFTPWMRSSSFSPLGTNLSDTPGSTPPMTPARSMRQCALVTAGAVSVDPQEVVSQISRPSTRLASACSRSQLA